MKMALSHGICLVIILSIFHSTLSQSSNRHNINPGILQDSRDLPQVDGAFGFLYRTEDGIAHGAIGEPGGKVHGRYTYTDPTGLKVNFNYFTGSGRAPADSGKQNALPAYQQPQPRPQPQPQPQARPRPRPSQPVYEYDDEPEPQYQPQPRPRPSQPVYDIPQPQHRLQPRPPPSQPRYNRPPPPPRNDIDYGSYTI